MDKAESLLKGILGVENRKNKETFKKWRKMSLYPLYLEVIASAILAFLVSFQYLVLCMHF